MKKMIILLLNSFSIVCVLLYCNLASATDITVYTADNYPYNSLINRTDDVKIHYITNNGSISCSVEVVLDKMIWTSVEKKISKEAFNTDVLSYCLSKETAEQILLQTFLQFGRGL